MAKSDIPNFDVSASSNVTWFSALNTINDIIDVIQNDALTASSNNDVTIGDATLEGTFTANTISLGTLTGIGNGGIIIDSDTDLTGILDINETGQRDVLSLTNSSNGPVMEYNNGTTQWYSGFYNPGNGAEAWGISTSLLQTNTPPFYIETSNGKVTANLFSSANVSIDNAEITSANVQNMTAANSTFTEIVNANKGIYSTTEAGECVRLISTNIDTGPNISFYGNVGGNTQIVGVIASQSDGDMEIRVGDDVSLENEFRVISNYFKSEAVGGTIFTSGPNVFVAGNNRLGKSTSSRRYKNEIEPCDMGLSEIKTLQPKRWVEHGTDKEVQGLIAEEVYETPLKNIVNLIEWKGTEKQIGNGSIPMTADGTELKKGSLVVDSIDHMALLPVLINSIKELEKRLEKIENGTAS